MPDAIDPGTVLVDMLDLAASLIDPTDEGMVGDYAFRLSAVQTLIARLQSWQGMLETALLDSMPEDRVEVDGVGVLTRYERKSKVTWDAERVRTAVRTAILDRVSLNPETGEYVPALRAVAAAAIEHVTSTWTLGAPLTGRNAGIRRLGLNPDDYRSFTSQGYGVELRGLT